MEEFSNIHSLTVKFLHQEATPQELMELKELLKDAENKKEFNQLVQLNDTINQKLFNTDNALAKVHQKINAQEPKVISLFNFKNVLKIAATLALAVGVGYFVQYYTTPKNTIYTASTFVRDIELPDGTKVKLNKGSVLLVANDFNQEKRNIWFRGEAYFEIARDTTKECKILMNNSKVTILGTAFNIKNYRTDKNAIVTVTHGKVRFSNTKNESIELEKYEEGNLTIENQQLNKSKASIEILRWKNPELKFENQDLKSLCEKLEQCYPIQFEIKNSALYTKKYTGSFNTQTQEEVCESIAFALSCTYLKENQKVVFR